MKSKLAYLVGAISFTVVAAAHSSDLLEIYGIAKSNDPVYQAAEFRTLADQYNLPLAKSAFKPAFTSAVESGKNKSNRTGVTTTSDNKSLNLNVTLPLFDRAKSALIRQAEKRVSASDLELREANQKLILRVATRYFNLLAARDAMQVSTVEKIAIKRQMDLARERVSVGLSTHVDLFDASARFRLAEADELRAQNTINNERALLKQVIGTTPQRLSPLKADAPLDPPSPNNLDDWITQSESNNLRLQIDQFNLGIALDEIARQKNVKSPVLSVEGNYNFSDAPSNFGGPDDSESTNISLNLRLPIYLGGTAKLLRAQSGLQYHAVFHQLEESRRTASTDATAAFLDVNSEISQIKALFAAITAGEAALEAKAEGFRAGLTTNLDVLDAQRDLSQSRTNYLRARYNYILSFLQLEAAVGDLDEGDVMAVNQWLEQSD